MPVSLYYIENHIPPHFRRSYFFSLTYICKSVKTKNKHIFYPFDPVFEQILFTNFHFLSPSALLVVGGLLITYKSTTYKLIIYKLITSLKKINFGELSTLLKQTKTTMPLPISRTSSEGSRRVAAVHCCSNTRTDILSYHNCLQEIQQVLPLNDGRFI